MTVSRVLSFCARSQDLHFGSSGYSTQSHSLLVNYLSMHLDRQLQPEHPIETSLLVHTEGRDPSPTASILYQWACQSR